MPMWLAISGADKFQCGLAPAACWCGTAPCRSPGRRPDGLGLGGPQRASDRPVPRGCQSRPRPFRVQSRVALPGLRVVCGRSGCHRANVSA